MYYMQTIPRLDKPLVSHLLTFHFVPRIETDTTNKNKILKPEPNMLSATETCTNYHSYKQVVKQSLITISLEVTTRKSHQQYQNIR